MVTLDRSAEPGTDGAPLLDIVPDALRVDPCDSLSRQEALDQLRQAFRALPEKDRLVLSLYYYERLTLKQIGEVFHVTESRVSQIHRRAIGRLREQVQLAEEGA
jgi:RNA polymerase sigma factor for flagellar operon FliA